MSDHDPEVSIRQMAEHTAEALDLMEGRSREDLERDRMLELALTRLLEIIGEAANRIPRSVQQDYPEIPWPEVVSLRNRLIHAYDAVDLDIVWRIVRDDLPPLLRELRRPR